MSGRYDLPAKTNVQGDRGIEPARELLNALAFWDSKRPVTAGLLGRPSGGRPP